MAQGVLGWTLCKKKHNKKIRNSFSSSPDGSLCSRIVSRDFTKSKCAKQFAISVAEHKSSSVKATQELEANQFKKNSFCRRAMFQGVGAIASFQHLYHTHLHRLKRCTLWKENQFDMIASPEAQDEKGSHRPSKKLCASQVDRRYASNKEGFVGNALDVKLVVFWRHKGIELFQTAAFDSPNL